ncbi:carbohydrate ABC transporter permease [Ectobacillus antri]|jgi:raffinose/stachyose/melibiose transport system permease protein|uniref:Carbohydrate ABC transporter permease n=1 Tax=Ectobacillus antri TaxID=2486280 RepID=A0ABT6H5Y3_9BACI|nr:carbohydrate ABC transporter permease [Ectobacillus antri]MDG4657735.1 carbohydrate ABC transporter permease [Ectobacillus antri]MDG5754742.1 carbohydrate ABC transporter permease [Ectobacillus antri]
MLRTLLLFLYALLIIIPIGVIVGATFKDEAEIYKTPFSLPDSLSFGAYGDLLSHQEMGLYAQNSAIVTVSSMLLTLLFASFIAFAITQLPPWPARLVFVLFVFGMLVPAQVSMIPLYQVVTSLQLTNSLTGLVLVNIASTMSIAVFILTGFMKMIPKSLFEAAIMDGASYWHMYARIVIPLSLPSLASTAIFLVVMHWNDLLYPLLFITDNQKKTLPLALLGFQGEYITNYPVLFAGVILSSLPIVIAYIFLQRFFVSGLTAGATKS